MPKADSHCERLQILWVSEIDEDKCRVASTTTPNRRMQWNTSENWLRYHGESRIRSALLVNFKAVVTGTKVSERRRSLFMRAPQSQSTTQLQQEVLQRFQQEPPRCTQQLSLHNKLHANTIGASAWNVTVAALNRERERSVESKKNIESKNARLNSASHVNTKNTLRKRPPWTVASYRK